MNERDVEDEMGGDPPCWVHLWGDEFETGDGASGSTLVVADLAELAVRAHTAGVAWSQQSDDLNVNFVVFGAGEGVDAHINVEVDVLIVVLSGDGTLVIDDVHRPVRAGQAVVIPKGARRALRGCSQGIAYLTCHRRRAGLWPTSRRETLAVSGDSSMD